MNQDAKELVAKTLAKKALEREARNIAAHLLRKFQINSSDRELVCCLESSQCRNNGDALFHWACRQLKLYGLDQAHDRHALEEMEHRLHSCLDDLIHPVYQ